MVIVESRVGYGALHEAFAVFYGAGNLDWVYVFAQGGHLGCLCPCELPFGVEHGHAYAVELEEAVCRCRPGVSGGRNEYVAAVGGIGVDSTHESRHEAGSVVFECECGAVKELEHVGVVADEVHWRVEGKRLVDDRFEGGTVDVLAEK